MAKLILKAPFYGPKSKTPAGKGRSGYAEYIATREGVEVIPRSGMADYIGERRGSNGLFSDKGAADRTFKNQSGDRFAERKYVGTHLFSDACRCRTARV